MSLRRSELKRKTALVARSTLRRGRGLKRAGRMTLHDGMSRVTQGPPATGTSGSAAAARPALRATPLQPVSEKQKVVNRLDAAWSRLVRARDGYCCQARALVPEVACIGSVVAHHIKPKEDYPAYRHDPDNGISVCPAHHYWIHDQDPKKARRLGLLV